MFVNGALKMNRAFPSMTVGLLKEIWKEHNVSDDDVIEFQFTTQEYDPTTDIYGEAREMEFEGIYKREFGILMDFQPTEIKENDE
jgi:hypothetical protein